LTSDDVLTSPQKVQIKPNQWNVPEHFLAVTPVSERTREDPDGLGWTRIRTTAQFLDFSKRTQFRRSENRISKNEANLVALTIEFRKTNPIGAFRRARRFGLGCGTNLPISPPPHTFQ
jgi:hypothetical protein